MPSYAQRKANNIPDKASQHKDIVAGDAECYRRPKKHATHDMDLDRTAKRTVAADTK